MNGERGDRQISSWGDLFMRTMELGLGAATLTVETAQKVVNELINRGQVTREESTGLVDRLMSMGREQRNMLTDMVEKGVERAMNRMDLARRSDLEALRLRVAELERVVLGSTLEEGPIPPISEADLADNE